MKNNFALCILGFLLSVAANAQQRKTFKIQPGEKLTSVIPDEEKYSYASFKDGNVYFRQNTFSAAKLNYNALYGEMQFIDGKGDTLSLADESTIKFIVVDQDTFYYQDGFMKQLKDYGNIKLAGRTFFSFTNRQRLGAFGETTSASVDTYNAISGSSYFKELVAKEILTIAKNNVYYIGDQFNNFKVANRKNLLDIYAKKEKAIQQYLNEHKVDFSKERDLITLLDSVTSTTSN